MSYSLNPSTNCLLQLIRQVMSTISIRFGRYKSADELSDNINNFSKAVEIRSCWSVLSIDRLRIEAKEVANSKSSKTTAKENISP
ncbi:MAG: hypothetical protein WAJ93_09940 [Candidatus Nitrosopolaris sp.]